MRLDFWQGLGVVCGAIIAAGTLVGLTYRWVVQPVWRTIKRLNRVADNLLGDVAAGVPSLSDRVAASTEQSAETAAAVRGQSARIEEIAHRLDEHLTWHAGGGDRSNGRGPVPVRDPSRRR